MLLHLSLTIIPFMALSIVGGSPLPLESSASLLSMKSEEINSYINASANPCDNFYNFACGHWSTIHPATLSQLQTNPFQLAKLKWKRKVLQMLATRNVNDTQIEGTVKDYYEACLNLPSLDVYGDKLKDIINEFGRMPAIEGDKWQEQNFDWVKTVAEISHRYGIKIILGYVIRPDADDSTLNTLRIRHPKFKPSVFYAEGPQQNEYKTYIADKLKTYLGLNAHLAHQTAHEIVDFETQLAKGTTEDPLATTETIYPTSVSDLQRQYLPHVDFKKLLQISLGSLPKDDFYEVYPEYHENLIELSPITPKRTIANYIFYKLISAFLPPTLETGVERQHSCQENMKAFFANVMDNMMYRKYDSKRAEQAVINMFQDLRSVFDSALSSTTHYQWISKKTRKRALEKLRAMRIKVNSHTDVNFTQEFAGLSVDKHDYVGNVKSLYSLRANKTRAKLNEPFKPQINGAKSSFTPEYVLTENTIRMPLASLQPPIFWSPANPNAVNLGQLGYLLGHEMIHAFDDLGRQFDRHGNIRDWWEGQSARNFANRTQCFRDQTKNYTYAGKSLPQTQHQAENIADNGGMRMAYEVYATWLDIAWRLQMKVDKEMMPGLSYRDKQLFFISYAQVWCSDTHPDYVEVLASMDTHLPPSFRINGPLSNFEEFSHVFQCPQGSAMNPVNKCQIY